MHAVAFCPHVPDIVSEGVKLARAIMGIYQNKRGEPNLHLCMQNTSLNWAQVLNPGFGDGTVHNHVWTCGTYTDNSWALAVAALSIRLLNSSFSTSIPLKVNAG